MESSNKRPKNLGFLFAVAGFGGSGSSTISKMLARHFSLNRVYAGGLMRELAKSKGYESLEKFLESTTKEEMEQIDKDLDKKMIKYSYQKDMMIDAKVFAALAHKYHISTTVSIWLDSSLEVRAKRNSLKNSISYEQAYDDLKRRFELDNERYGRIYNIDYASPKKYNDIVLDTSKLNEFQTLNIILKLIKDGGYTSKGK